MEEIEKIYKLYFKDVYKYLLYLTKNKEMSEEIVQETFFIAINSIDKFRNDSSIKTWLFSIARNTYFQKLRKSKKISSIEDLELYTSKICLENDYIVKENLDKIREIVNKKDEISKKVFHLRCEGKSFQEIADELKISYASARVIFCRLRKIIKESLEV